MKMSTKELALVPFNYCLRGNRVFPFVNISSLMLMSWIRNGWSWWIGFLTSKDALHLDVQSPYDAIVIATSHNRFFLGMRNKNAPLVKCTMKVLQIDQPSESRVSRWCSRHSQACPPHPLIFLNAEKRGFPHKAHNKHRHVFSQD